MDIDKFETPEDVLELIRRIKDRIERCKVLKTKKTLQQKARDLLNLYFNFESAKRELRHNKMTGYEVEDERIYY